MLIFHDGPPLTLFLYLFQQYATNAGELEMINGGYGIKNPKFTEKDSRDSCIKDKGDEI